MGSRRPPSPTLTPAVGGLLGVELLRGRALAVAHTGTTVLCPKQQQSSGEALGSLRGSALVLLSSFSICIQYTPDRKNLPEGFTKPGNTSWIPLLPSAPIQVAFQVTSLKRESPEHPFLNECWELLPFPLDRACVVQSGKEET